MAAVFLFPFGATVHVAEINPYTRVTISHG